MSTTSHQPERPWLAGPAGATVLVVAVAAVVAGASGNSPAGVPVADVVWSSALAAVVALAGSRAKPSTLLWLSGLAVLTAVRGDAVAVVLGVVALVGALAVVAFDRPTPWLSPARAAVAATAVAAFLYGPSYGFRGLPSVVATVALVPVLWSGARSLGRTGRRRVLIGSAVLVGVLAVASVGANLAAFRARPVMSDAAQDAKQGLKLARDGSVTQASQVLRESNDRFAESSSMMDGILAWPGRFVPVVGHQVEAVRRVSLAGQDLTGTAADVAERADYRSLRTDAGTIDVAQLEAMQEPIAASLAAATDARGVIDDVRSPWLLPILDDKLDELDGELSQTIPTVEVVSRAVAVAPTLLGADGPQRYLLQFATPGEARGAGGLIGTHGILVSDGGTLTLEGTGSTEALNVPRDQPSRPFDPPPGWEARYAAYDVGRYLGNVSADPDWPTDSDVARQLYAQVPGTGDLAGTIYADPAALAAILSLTGPIEVPGVDGPLGADNVEQYLLLDQYSSFDTDVPEENEARREALTAVTDATFDAITTRQLPDLAEVLNALGPAVAGGHLKVVAFDGADGGLFDETGLSGAWDPTPGSDYLSMRITNLLPNKIETLLDRQVSVDVQHDPESGATTSAVSITVTNDAPATGGYWYIVGNYDDLPPATNRTEIALYSPLELGDATLDGAPIGMLRQRYGSGWVYSFPVQLAPGPRPRCRWT